jgi:hypothetical protein
MASRPETPPARDHPDRTARRADIAWLRLARTPGQPPGRPARSVVAPSPRGVARGYHGSASRPAWKSRCDGCRVWDRTIAGAWQSAGLEPMRFSPVTTSQATETPRSTRVSKFITAIADLRRTENSGTTALLREGHRSNGLEKASALPRRKRFGRKKGPRTSQLIIHISVGGPHCSIQKSSENRTKKLNRTTCYLSDTHGWQEVHEKFWKNARDLGK